MKSIERISGTQAISNYDFNGNPGKIVTTNKNEYVFNQYEELPWVRLADKVRGTLKIDLRLKRVIFNS
jgi:hypothetical protein